MALGKIIVLWKLCIIDTIIILAQPNFIETHGEASAKVSLTLPGRVLNMSVLCVQKKF